MSKCFQQLGFPLKQKWKVCHSLVFQIAAVSTLVNHTVLKPYVFRNYTLPLGSDARFLGGCNYKLWEALRASSAAPGFFEECKLNHDIHQVQLNLNHSHHQDFFERGSTEGQGAFERQRRKQFRGVIHPKTFARFTAVEKEGEESGRLLVRIY